MDYYIITIYEEKTAQRVLRLLRKHGVKMVAVAVLVSLEGDKGILGGIKRVDSRNIAILRGYLPLPK